ncbi:T9SS type A sorting domain-containing protein [Rufibacter latericius]|uniref:T9SS C-terminal target domain-containing protein n=1 Tax=Rufibacter latericius TaxID=2487040 RepID=A0A3M9MW38_9BACT|nr:T9SS type A sorting domain-containing protein [Rufibacter latericius]RNI29327.1 T9SS C-terminal target domain-containing protein [Rufibacter latericius]
MKKIILSWASTLLLILFGFISQAQAQCAGSAECFDFKLVSAASVNASTTRLTFSVKVNCNKDLSNVAFELPAGVKASSPKGQKYNYTVENTTNNPFYSVKFEGKGINGYKNGAEDVFTYDLPTASFSKMTSMRIQAKAGQNVGTFSFNPKNCAPGGNSGGGDNGGGNPGGGNTGGGDCSDSQPRPIIGDQHPCAGDIVTYCIENDRNYTSFVWDVPRAHAGEPPVGWEIISGQGTKCVTVRVGQKSGTMKVKVNDPICGTKVATLPVKPGKSFEVTIAGPVSICVKQPQTYTASVKKNNGNGNGNGNAKGEFIFNWTVPADWTIQSGQGTDKIVVIPGSTDGEVNVYVSDNAKVSGNGNNGNGVGGYKKGYCGTASDGLEVITKEDCGTSSTCPTFKVDITGQSLFCKGDVLTFDAVVAGAGNVKTKGGAGTSTWSKNNNSSDIEYAYQWAVPTGWEVVSGQGTSQLIVKAGTAAGNVGVNVTAKKKKDPKFCGTGTDTQPVTVNPVCGQCPKPELAVDGPSEVCHSTNDLYTFRVKNVKTGVKYHFYLPEEFTVVESGNGYVKVDVNSAKYDTTLYVTVVAINASNCGAEAVCLSVNVKDCGTTPPCEKPTVALVAPDTICNLADEPTTIRVAQPQEGVTYSFNVPEGFIVLEEGADYVTVVAVFEEEQLGQPQTITVTATNECGTATAQEVIIVADCGLGNPLPVSLTKFEGASRGGAVTLAWTTVSEINNDRFEVERSANGKDFVMVGQVKGSGNSSATVDYTYTDRTAAAGTVYYRLKQVDFDNSTEYSKVIAVSHAATANNNAGISVYPNPVTDRQVNVRFQEPVNGKASIRLVDMSGRVLHTQDVNSVASEVPVNLTNLNLKAGVYLITVNVNGQSTTQRIMVR